MKCGLQNSSKLFEKARFGFFPECKIKYEATADASGSS